MPDRKTIASAPGEHVYEPDELEFLQALDRFKREKQRPFPSCLDVLEVLKGLGWKKGERTAAAPSRQPADVANRQAAVTRNLNEIRALLGAIDAIAGATTD